MGSYNSGRATDLGGLNIEQRRSDSLNGIRFDANRAAPTSSNDFMVYRRAGALYLWNGTTETNLGAGGGEAAGTLDTAYENGREITVDAGAVVFAGADEDTAVLNITANGTSAGACILIANSGSGNDVTGTAGWSVTAAGLATFATNSVVSGILILTGSEGELTTGGTYNLILSTNSGTNSSEIEIVDGANGDIDITLDGTGAVNINGTTETNDALVIGAGDVGIEDGSLTIVDDDAANTLTVTNDAHTTASATTGGIVEFQSTSLTSGALLNLELTSAEVNGGQYLRCYDVTDGGDVLTIGEDGATVITGVAGSDMLAVTNGDVSVADGSLTIVDGDNAVTLSVTNDTATTSDVVEIAGAGTFTGAGSSAFVQIVPSGLTSGDAVSITTDAMTSGTALLLDSAGTLVTTGSMLEILADGATTAAGVVRVSVDGLTQGKAVLIDQDGETLTSGELLTISNVEDGNLATITGNLVSITSDLEEDTGTVTANYDMLLLSRSDTQSHASQYDAQGSVVKILKTLDKAAGTIVDAVIGLEIESAVANTALPLGATVQITEVGVAATALNIVSASTTVSDVLITGSGVKADNKGVLEVTNSGATAAGGSILRVTNTGTPAAATSYLVDFDYVGATTSSNPDLMHIAQEGTGRALHIEGDGLQAAAKPALEIESTNAGAVGAVLALTHSGGTQAASDVTGMIVFTGEDDGPAANEYGRIDCTVIDPAAGSESASLDFFAGDADGGTSQALQLTHDGSNGFVTAGDGAATAIIESNGNFDLQLQTGNATTGNITITDGAAGSITLTPNGAGAVDLAGKILHSETTTSTGAGAVAITGSVHEISATGTGDAMTLANGTEGQILHICYVAENAGGDTSILTPASFNETSILFATLGDSVTLVYTAAKWYVIGNGGATINA